MADEVKTRVRLKMDKRVKTTLSPGEILYLYRTRREKNQVEMAAYFSCGVDVYRAWEAGVREHDVPILPSEPMPYLSEYCAILRRRYGFTQRELGMRIGKTRVWVNRMERGLEDCTTLLKFWELNADGQSIKN